MNCSITRNIKRQGTARKKIFVIFIKHKSNIFNRQKNVLNLGGKKRTKVLQKNGLKIYTDNSQRDINMAFKHMKRCLALLIKQLFFRKMALYFNIHKLNSTGYIELQNAIIVSICKISYILLTHSNFLIVQFKCKSKIY